MRNARLLALLFLTIGPSIFGAEQRQQYIVMRKHLLFAQPNASAPPTLVGDEAIRGWGGKTDFRTTDRIVVTLPDAAVEALRNHPSVKYIQRVIRGPQAPITPAQTPSSKLAQTTSGLRQVSTAEWDKGQYSYDGAGNITSIGTNTFTYDSRSRLTTAVINGVTESYEYDAFGNLKQRTTGGNAVTIPVNSATNRLSGTNAVGHVEAIGSETYTYDPFGMMLRKSGGGTEEYYVYTADDQRIGAGTISTEHRWLWSIRDEGGRVIRQYESVGQAGSPPQPWLWIEDYVYGGSKLVAGERPPEEGGRRHFHLDHLGTPRLVTGSHAGKIAEHDYWPFGNEITQLMQETLNGFSREDPVKFTGHERDFTSGTTFENTNYLDYMRARSTNPSMGRFFSVDPHLDINKALHEPQMWNRYAYVTNNPLKYTDPDGRDRYSEPGFTKPLSEADWSDAPPAVQAAFYVQGTLAIAAAGDGIATLIGALRLVSSLERSIDDPASFTGAKPEQLRHSIPESWGPGVPTKKDGGMRWFNPDKRGEGIRIMPGRPGARDPMHAGPYAVFTRHGKEIRVPLAGNPVLRRPSLFKKLIDDVKELFR